VHEQNEIGLRGGAASLGDHFGRDYRQAEVVGEAAFEECLDADAAGIFDAGNVGSGSVLFRLVFSGNCGGLRWVVNEVGKLFEALFSWPEGHRVAIGQRQRFTAIVNIGMPGRLPHVLQNFLAEDGQVHDGGIAVIKVGTRKLAAVGFDHLRLAGLLIGIHARDRRKMNVRVDQAGNEVLAFAGDYPDACGRLGRWTASVDAEDVAVFDDHGASGDMFEIFGRDDGDVGDPGLRRLLAEGGVGGNGSCCGENGKDECESAHANSR